MPIRRCSKCRRLRLRRAFRWRDRNGNTGYGRRCDRCRRSSRRHGPLWLGEPRYRIRRHAVERYRERVRPELGFAAARTEMLERMAAAPLVGWDERPRWVQGSYHPRFRGFLLISEDVVFCLRNYGTREEERVMVSTVLSRRANAGAEAAVARARPLPARQNGGARSGTPVETERMHADLITGEGGEIVEGMEQLAQLSLNAADLEERCEEEQITDGEDELGPYVCATVEADGETFALVSYLDASATSVYGSEDSSLDELFELLGVGEDEVAERIDR